MKINNKQLKKVKLVVFDLDGTLLNNEGRIGEKTRTLVKKLSDEFGVFFSIASGRLHSAVTNYCNELNISIPVISLDGSLLKTLHNPAPVFSAYVKEKYVEKSIELAEKYFVKVVLCHADKILYTENNESILQVTDKFGAPFERVDSYDDYLDNVLEVFFAGENYGYIKHIKNKLSFPYSFGLSGNNYRSQSYKGIYYLEIRKKGCTKKTGLIKLLRYLNIAPRNCVVMGDWYNDRPLFETKAIKVAMANAVPEIKYLADYTTNSDNNNDGTGEFLEMLLKAKME